MQSCFEALPKLGLAKLLEIVIYAELYCRSLVSVLMKLNL